MALSTDPISKRKIVADSIHGDIELSKTEWGVVDTATFQRLRSLKQLGMGHLVYPNATHTRFAHSLGVFGIMSRILVKLSKNQGKNLKPDEEANLRMAALLHDIGHYPYSHLMERVDAVQLTEEELEVVNGQKEISAARTPYPDHEALGRQILESQSDICAAIGSVNRAREIGALFSRLDVADPQLSKLIHSSLDMDRLDYLLRDAKAAGVPYGQIDLNYLLSNIRLSPKGVLGVEYKALAAAEHFLLARHFMHRVVYYHKTIYGFEEACRQLLRRMRDSGVYDLARNGDEVKTLCSGPELLSFTDNYVDELIREAANEEKKDPIIQTLARCISSRTPPKLLAEVGGLQNKNERFHSGTHFRSLCKTQLPDLAKRLGIRLGQFLLCGPKPIKVEERSALLTSTEAKNLKPEEKEELIKVFVRGEDEPKSMVEINGSLINHLADHPYGIYRLYLADLSKDAPKRLPDISREVQKWTQPN